MVRIQILFLLLSAAFFVGCNDTAPKEAPTPVSFDEFISKQLDVQVDYNGEVQITSHSSFKAAGKFIRGGQCERMTDMLMFPGRGTVRPNYKLIFASSENPELPISSKQTLGRVDACAGKPGTRLKPGIYSWDLGVSSKNYILQTKEFDSLILGASPGTPVPVKEFSAQITFNRLVVAGATKSIPLNLVNARAVILKSRMDADYLKTARDVLNFSRDPSQGDVVKLSLKRPVLPGEVAYIEVYWPAFIYIDRAGQAPPSAATPTPVPTKAGPMF